MADVSKITLPDSSEYNLKDATVRTALAGGTTGQILKKKSNSDFDVEWGAESSLTFDDIYPVGSIYMSVNSTNPGTLFGGTWEQIQDRFLLAAGTTYTAGATGGEATHTLTVTEMPNHTHNIYGGDGDVPDWFGGSGNTYGIQARTKTAYDRLQYVGGNGAHNNMPPYLVVYIWKRTA
jgi:hypothetical protein